jgi:hypothetical protein
VKVGPEGVDFLLFHASIVHYFEQSIQFCGIAGGGGGAYTAMRNVGAHPVGDSLID